MLARRGRGRPKRAKNKRQRSTGEKHGRLLRTIYKNPILHEADSRYKRRLRLRQLVEAAVRKMDAYCEQQGYGPEKRDELRQRVRREYAIIEEIGGGPVTEEQVREANRVLAEIVAAERRSHEKG